MMEKQKRKSLDMLHGSIWNKLPVFALPVAATAILEQLFNASDIAVVGNFTGAGKTIAVAAVGANSSIISLIVNLFVGIALGANVVIANAIGRKDKEVVTKAVHTSIIIALLAGICVSIAGELVANPLLTSLQVPEDVFPEALLYLRIYLIGMPVILLYNFEAAIFRSTGDTKTPLVILTISGILNVLLNLFFVAALHMTVNGVRIDRKILGQIMRIGLPAGIQSAVFAIANIVIQSAINSLGTVVMAASSAAYNIEIFAYDVLNSFSQACTTFVGQNYGAGQIRRCRKILILCIVEDAIAMICAIVLILLTGRSLLSIFNNDPQVISVGYTRLIMVFSAYTFSMLYENMSGYMRGFGFSLIPAIVTTLGICGVRIFWIMAVFPVHRTFVGILTAYPVSLSVTALLMLILLIIYRPTKRFQTDKGEM